MMEYADLGKKYMMDKIYLSTRRLFNDNHSLFWELNGRYGANTFESSFIMAWMEEFTKRNTVRRYEFLL